MKFELKIPTIKPRDFSGHQILKNKVNAAGKHRDKKLELKNGLLKYKNQIHKEIESGDTYDNR